MKTFKVAFIKKAYEEKALEYIEKNKSINLTDQTIKLIYEDFAIQFLNQFKDKMNFKIGELTKKDKIINEEINLIICSIDVPRSSRKSKPTIYTNPERGLIESRRRYQDQIDTNIEIPPYKNEQKGV